jgi:hypothetical protein
MLVLVIALSGCDELPAQTEFPDSLILQMSVSDSQLQDGRVVLESSLENRTNQKRTFLPWNTPFDVAVTGRFLKVVEHLGDGRSKELSYIGIMVKRRPAVVTDFQFLGIGERKENRLEITKNYNFCQERRYSISFTGQLYDLNNQMIPFYSSVAQFATGVAFPLCDRQPF